MLKKTIVLFFLLITSFSFSESLKEKFIQGEVGSYIITLQNNTYTLLHFHSRNKDKIVLEEISIPSHQLNEKTINWKHWVSQKAPGHTSWLLYEIDLDQNQMTECYSYNREVYLQKENTNPLVTTLIGLNLTPLPDEQRIKIAASSRAGAIEEKKRFWNPPQYIEGEKIKTPSYDVYSTLWPKDQTELSNKRIVLYFDHFKKEFPFPYWVQIEEGKVKFKIRAIDSGKGLISPYKKLEKQRLDFTHPIQKNVTHLLFTLGPANQTELKLYAIDTSLKPSVTHSVPFELKKEKDKLILSIKKEELSSLFLKGHQYIWIVVTKDDEQFIEYPYPFVWEP